MATLGIEAIAATVIRAPREKCYDAFATADGLDAWFTKGARVDARPGGEMLWHWVDWGVERGEYTVHGRVLEARRPERFVFEWWGDDEARKTTVEVTFEARDDGTVVRVREHGFLDDDKGRSAVVGNSSGWGEALTLMRFWVEHGIAYDTPAPAAARSSA